MRLAPVPMFYAHHAKLAIDYSGDSSRTTHAASQAIDACRYYGALILGALQGQPKDELLSPPSTWGFLEADVRGGLAKLDPTVVEVVNGSFKEKEPPYIQGSGYVVRGMEAALWAFHHSADFRQGALLAANLGDDADTTTAIYGQLAGAYYGLEGIPAEWRARIVQADLILSFADKLFELAVSV